MKKRRRVLAPFLMLFSGAVIGLVLLWFRYELADMMVILLLTMICFYVIGFFITKMLERFERQNETKALLSEGEVIEKDVEESTEENSGSAS